MDSAAKLPVSKRQISSDGDGISITASVLLLDIEGTTTSISFVKDELFPYITKNLRTYLSENWDTEQTQEDVEALYLLSVDDMKQDLHGAIPVVEKDEPKERRLESVIANVTWQMRVDRKSTALKQLQGHMWSHAYEKGEVRGHLYAEVADCFKRWKKKERRVCIYSSGSVAAQKLLFKFSVNGDLSEYIEDYFDTKVGAKREPKSYARIAESLKVEPCDILFLTDIYEEAEAAREAGMAAIILVRPGNKPLSVAQSDTFKTVMNFNKLIFSASEQACDKRKKIDNE